MVDSRSAINFKFQGSTKGTLSILGLLGREVNNTMVLTFPGNKSPKKKGKSKRAHVLVAAVERATANFVERGNQV